MSNFKGTKGEWWITYSFDDLETGIGCNGSRIAEVKHYRNTKDPSNEEGYANALLISKAPEMLEMLELACIELETGGKKHWEIYSMMRKLIKEATEI